VRFITKKIEILEYTHKVLKSGLVYPLPPFSTELAADLSYVVKASTRIPRPSYQFFTRG
jgi:hypothetical protein